MVLSQISSKFHRFQQITNHGKVNIQRKANGKKRLWYSDFARHICIFVYIYISFCWLQISNIFQINFAKPAWAQIRFPSFNNMFKFINRDYLFHVGWYIIPMYEPMYDKLSNPWLTVLAQGIAKYEWFLILYWLCCLTGKASAKITGLNPLKTLNNSTASVLRFLWCIETDSSFSKRSSKDDFLSL